MSTPLPGGIKEQFEHWHVPIRKEWLEAIVDFASPQCAEQYLPAVVFHQWLHAHIRTTTRPSLSDFLARAQAPGHSLYGCIILQVWQFLF